MSTLHRLYLASDNRNISPLSTQKTAHKPANSTVDKLLESLSAADTPPIIARHMLKMRTEKIYQNNCYQGLKFSLKKFKL
jgi:hypothetical protein